MNWVDGGTGTLAVGSVALEYATWGPGPETAPTLVLLHEGLGCVALWRDFPQKLAAQTGFGVFVYSRAGYGQSDPADLPRPIDYMTREATDVLPHILDQAGIVRAVLVGHSDGATIAAIYAGSVSDQRIRGLVLMAPHFFTEGMGLSAIADARDAYEEGDLRERLAKYHRDVDATFRGWNDVWLNEAFEDWNVSDVIDYLRIPTLAIQGRQDQYGTLAHIEEVETRSYAPVDVVVFEDCRHSPHLDQPDATLAAIESFTSRLERIEHAVPIDL